VVLYVGPGQGTVSVVAGRRIGKAEARNRARRILREAWHRLAPLTEGRDVVLVARPAIEGSTTNDLVSEMRDLLPRMGIHTDPEQPS
jgi:ribonuclease P protein component